MIIKEKDWIINLKEDVQQNNFTIESTKKDIPLTSDMSEQENKLRPIKRIPSNNNVVSEITCFNINGNKDIT